MGEKIFLVIGSEKISETQTRIIIPLVILDAESRGAALDALPRGPSPKGFRTVGQTTIAGDTRINLIDSNDRELEMVETTVIRARSRRQDKKFYPD